MKRNRLHLSATTTLLWLMLAGSSSAQQTRYQLIDLGTLGGPNSGVPTVFYEINGTAGARDISNNGTATGNADTLNVDPLCFFDDCLYPSTYQSRNGVLTNLGALPGGLWSAPNWISANGIIAGLSENGQSDPFTGFPIVHGAVWGNGQVADIGTLAGGSNSIAWSVNSAGRVAAFSTNGTPDPFSYLYFQFFGFGGGTQTRAVVWDPISGMHDLGTLGGPDAWAALINEQGQVAGISYTSSNPNADNGGCGSGVPTQDPFFWSSSAGMVDIGTFGGTCGVPNALNNKGQVAGQSFLAGNTTARAFLWSLNGTPRLRDLGTLGGDNASALWMDDAGHIVGYSDLSPGNSGCVGLLCVHHAVLWRNGVITDLGSIGTDPCSRATGVNAAGVVIGFSAAVCGGESSHGFIWHDGGPAVDLNTLVTPESGLTLAEPIYINDQGEITGFARLDNGDTHAFLLIPCAAGSASCTNKITAATTASTKGHLLNRFRLSGDGGRRK